MAVLPQPMSPGQHEHRVLVSPALMGLAVLLVLDLEPVVCVKPGFSRERIPLGVVDLPGPLASHRDPDERFAAVFLRQYEV